MAILYKAMAGFIILMILMLKRGLSEEIKHKCYRP